MNPLEERSNLQAVSPLTVMVEDRSETETSSNNDELGGIGRNTGNVANDATSTSPNVAKKPRTKWRKPEDKPHHPLTGYNFFFQLERERMLLGIDHIPITREDVINLQARTPRAVGNKSSSYEDKSDRSIHSRALVGEKLGFADLTRNIATKWKTLDPQLKILFDVKADEERARYKRELEKWNEEQKKKRNQPEMVRNSSSRSLLPLHEQNIAHPNHGDAGNCMDGIPLSSLQTSSNNGPAENSNMQTNAQVYHNDPVSRNLSMSYDNIVSPHRESWSSPMSRAGTLEDELVWHLSQRRGSIVTPQPESRAMPTKFRQELSKELQSAPRSSAVNSCNEYSPVSVMNSLPSKINQFIEESCYVSEDLHALAKMSAFDRSLVPQLREMERQIEFCINESRRLSSRVRDFISFNRKELFESQSEHVGAPIQEPQFTQSSHGQYQNEFDIPTLMNEMRRAMEGSGQLDEIEFRQRLENRKRILEYELAHRTEAKKQCRQTRDAIDTPMARRVSDMSEANEQRATNPESQGSNAENSKCMDSVRLNQNLSELLGSMLQKHTIPNFGRDGYTGFSHKFDGLTKDSVHGRPQRKFTGLDRHGANGDGRYSDEIRLEAGFESDIDDTSVIGNMECEQAFDVESMFSTYTTA